MTQPLLDRARPLTAQVDAATARQVFGALLEALATPGRPQPLAASARPQPLAAAAGLPPTLVPLLALARPGTTFRVLGDRRGWQPAVASVTGATPAPATEATLVAALRPVTPDDVAALRAAPPDAPEQVTKLIVGGEAAGAGEGGIRLRLRGLGIPSQTHLTVTGVDLAVFLSLGQRSAAGNGVDTFLVSGAQVVGLPRTTSYDAPATVSP